MAPKLPQRVTPKTPSVFQGEIYNAVGKYARGAVLFAFEEMGGPVELAEWGKRNPDDFYTKLLPKIIARESEVQHTRSVDDIMDLLDTNYEVIEDAETVPVDQYQPTMNTVDWGESDLPVASTTERWGDDWDVDDDLDAFDIDNFVEFPDD